MDTKRRWRVIVLATGALMVASVAGPGPARETAAQDYPTKPVRLIVPYPAGGALDLTSRAVVSVAEQYLGQPMIVVIRSGGGGAVGAEAAAKSRPDGYTIFMGDPGSLVIVPQVQKVAYGPSDFVALGQFVALPAVLSVRADAPWKTAKEFLEDARKNPGKIKHSSVTFSPEHLMYETLAAKYGAKFTHVPQPGGGPAMAALLGGHVDSYAPYPPVVFPHLTEGKVRALGLAGRQRWPAFADVPTLKEQGIDVEAYLWIALFAVKGTPDPVVAKLQEVTKKIAEDTSFKTLMTRMGQHIDYMSAAEFARHWAEEQAATKTLLEKIGR